MLYGSTVQIVIFDIHLVGTAYKNDVTKERYQPQVSRVSFCIEKKVHCFLLSTKKISLTGERCSLDIYLITHSMQ